MSTQTTEVPLAAARAIIEQLVDRLRGACERIAIAGSVRRQKPAVKDAKAVLIPTPELLPLTDDLVLSGQAQYALYGENRSKRWGQQYRGLMYEGLRCELFMTQADSWGYQYWLRTGPGEANTFIMRWLSSVNAPVRFQDGQGWYSRHWRRTAKGTTVRWEAADRQRLAIPDEAALFAVLGLPALEPQERTEAIYRKLTNVREFKWPDYTPHFARDPEQMALFAEQRVAHFFDGDLAAVTATDRAAQLEAERAYNRALMARRGEACAPWSMTFRG